VKQHSNVTEMVGNVSAELGFAESFAAHIAQRQVIKFLICLRAAANKSQKEIAEAMRCSQSRISKMENGQDGDLRLEDFHAYVTALGST
jgi:predicted XRE-type DNA-binding protein